MIDITVITPTARGIEALEVVKKALKRQTFERERFEWIIVTPSNKNEGDVWTLNKDYNRALRQAKGNLIISWQDYTSSDATTLEKFYYHFTKDPQTLVSAIGNKYKDDTFTIETWRDPRIEQGKTYYEVPFHYIEFNLCAIPKQALIDVGGFDEELDKWYGMDGYSVVDRLNLLGTCKFKIDSTIRSYSLEHGRPSLWEEKGAIHGPYEARRKIYLDNPDLNYL